jgi:acetyl-CoA carboxylase biotin carboxylase subunit
MFKKILIANRGEIAVRVIRACHEMGIAAAAVYSQADRAGLHVRRADEAYLIGPPAAAESYLNIEHVISAAQRCGADGIHPGYGFLSENPGFARACQDAGIKFIGPRPEAMELMGSKTRARKRMENAGVAFVPGTSSGVQSLAEARETAARLGYPVMLKAAAGGGGKGMRLVSSESELASALEAAQSEALRAFGDGEVYLEKAIIDPRHIEMQILADEHGNTLYLGERECSVQRRHQKVLEESPSPVASTELREKMGDIAVKAAQAAKYTNAGTIEFLADNSGNFYFLEMNTRLQVEHPVTELTTGLDLVQWQIRIASGEKLPFRQEDVKLRGHAIECRIYAEDPENNYFPSPGKITALREPGGPGIRLDSGIYEGWNVPLEYDPLLAKLIAYGENREQAIGRIRRALEEYFVAGVKTNLPLFRRIFANPDFLRGRTDTGLLDRMPEAVKSDLPTAQTPLNDESIVAISAAIFNSINSQQGSSRNGSTAGPDSIAPSSWKKIARSEALR